MKFQTRILCCFITGGMIFNQFAFAGPLMSEQISSPAFSARMEGRSFQKKAQNNNTPRKNKNMQAINTNNKKDHLINLEVEKYALKNGMTVLLHEDFRAPQVYHQVLIKTGSRHEVEGKTGLAHLFEHMMFRGTKKYTSEEYEEKLESIGARNNAWTSRDYTAYHVLLPSHALKTVIEIEAERLNSLRLTQSNLDKEKEVVQEERRMTTDNNPNEFFEPMMNLVFPSHSYGRPILGWMKDLEAMSLEDCKQFYRSYYAPNNAILVLAGNFDKKKAKKWIQRYYGALKPSQLPKPPVYEEPAQKKAKRAIIKRAIQAPTLVFAYRGPKAGDKEAYSLDVLNQVLTRGESSRLHKLLVYQKKLALSVGGFYYELEEEGLFIVIVKMSPAGDLNQAKKLVLAEIKKARTTHISNKERLKSSRMIMNDYVSVVKTLSGKANALSYYEAYFGDYQRLFSSLSEYEEVTAKSAKKTAQLYLNDYQVSMVQLLPKNL